jgi:small redox-active disulfide protein 1
MDKMVKLEIFYSPVCPYCPLARKMIREVAEKYPQLNVLEVNTYTEKGIERGMSMQIMAVPTVAIDDDIKLVGWPFTEEDLVKEIERSLA